MDHKARRLRLRAERKERATAKAKKREQQRREKAVIKARYDAVANSANSRRHWSQADGLNSIQANSLEVRKSLRERSRYEIDNNSILNGITSTLANDTIGTGPRLELLNEDISEEDRQIYEDRFTHWMKACGLTDKLLTGRAARTRDGEGFAFFRDNPQVALKDSFSLNPAVKREGVSLDVQLVECEFLSNPDQSNPDSATEVDGIKYDDNGNPISYSYLEFDSTGTSYTVKPVDASLVIHDFKAVRPQQRRGIPELTASLPLSALMRDYTITVCDAAKAAATFTGVFESQADPETEESEEAEAFEEIDVERNTFMTLPKGWKVSQMKAEQPTSTYREFKRELIAESARCVNMPFNIAAGDSSEYNFASGRLDHQTYDRSIKIDRAHIESVWMDRILANWHAEAVLIEGYLPQSFRREGVNLAHAWQWTEREHVDPSKVANANNVDLGNQTTNRREIYRRKGKDWKPEVQQNINESLFIAQQLSAAGQEVNVLDVLNAQEEAKFKALAAMERENDEE